MQRMFRSHGSGPVISSRQGLQSLWGMVMQQAAILSYIDVFIIFAIIFICMLPLLFIMKKPSKTAGPVAMH
jgi:DHA2 family multidrug resistance protein